MSYKNATAEDHLMKFDACFVDVDGTLTVDKSAWEKAHMYFDVSEQSKCYYEMAMRKEISYEQWSRLDATLWAGKSYDELKKAIFPVKIVKDAREGINYLKQYFKQVILVSGGIDLLVDYVKEQVGADLAVSNTIGHTNGIIDGNVVVRVGDSKEDTLKQLAIEYNIDLQRSAAIGNDWNDTPMFKSVLHAVAFNSRTRDLTKVACKSVDSKSFIDAAKSLVSCLAVEH